MTTSRARSLRCRCSVCPRNAAPGTPERAIASLLTGPVTSASARRGATQIARRVDPRELRGAGSGRRLAWPRSRAAEGRASAAKRDARAAARATPRRANATRRRRAARFPALRGPRIAPSSPTSRHARALAASPRRRTTRPRARSRKDSPRSPRCADCTGHRLPLVRRAELVAGAAQGLERQRVAQLGAQPAHVDVDRARAAFVPAAPDARQERLARVDTRPRLCARNARSANSFAVSVDAPARRRVTS